MKKYNVKTINGLQTALADAMETLASMDGRDQSWARAMIGGVNSGNSLMRTAALLSKPRPRKKAA